MQNKSILFLCCFIYNIIIAKAEPPSSIQIYSTTTVISCIAYGLIFYLLNHLIILYKNNYNTKKQHQGDDDESFASSDDSSTSIIRRYENVKDISSMVPVTLKSYITQQQWTDQINILKYNNTQRNYFFSFHPLYFPIVSGIVKFIQYYILYNQWLNYLNEKVKHNAGNIPEIQKIEEKYSMNVGESVIIKICMILVVEDILCFFMYYWLSKHMVKKNHSTFTSKFIRANELLKNEDIPLTWVLDWKSPEFNYYGFSERCYIELHIIEEDNIVIIK